MPESAATPARADLTARLDYLRDAIDAARRYLLRADAALWADDVGEALQDVNAAYLALGLASRESRRETPRPPGPGTALVRALEEVRP